MTHENWRRVVAAIRDATGTVTSKQVELATVAGIMLPAQLPRLVAGARLRAAFSSELGIPSPGPCNPIQQEIIDGLESDVAPPDGVEAEAWINFLRLKKREEALVELELQAGDIVEVSGPDGDTFREVSSIGSSGRVYFTGGDGAGSWPDMLVVRCRKSDDTLAARILKREAANRAALRVRAEWSRRKEEELQCYKVNSRLTHENIVQFQKVIESARDEKPVQQFIEAYPQVLTALLGGNNRFCVPRPSFGGKYTPDFLMSDVNSLGIRWVLVELETPESSVTLTSCNDLEEHARKGVSQVREWREWLQNNLDMARRSKEKDGLGLVDIRPRSQGLVLVGRRTRLLDNTSAVRNAIREESDIDVQTYDWLLDRLDGILSFSGPPGVNPHVLQPLRDDNHQWDGTLE